MVSKLNKNDRKNIIQNKTKTEQIFKKLYTDENGGKTRYTKNKSKQKSRATTERERNIFFPHEQHCTGLITIL